MRLRDTLRNSMATMSVSVAPVHGRRNPPQLGRSCCRSSCHDARPRGGGKLGRRPIPVHELVGRDFDSDRLGSDACSNHGQLITAPPDCGIEGEVDRLRLTSTAYRDRTPIRGAAVVDIPGRRILEAYNREILIHLIVIAIGRPLGLTIYLCAGQLEYTVAGVLDMEDRGPLRCRR